MHSLTIRAVSNSPCIYLRVNLDRADSTVPLVDHVVHGVAVGLDLQGAQLAVEGEVGEVHGAGGLHCQSHTSQYLSQVGDPQELVLLGGHVEVGRLLVDEERVGHPDLVDVVSSNNQLRHAVLNYIIMKVWLNNYIFTNYYFFILRTMRMLNRNILLYDKTKPDSLNI